MPVHFFKLFFFPSPVRPESSSGWQRRRNGSALTHLSALHSASAVPAQIWRGMDLNTSILCVCVRVCVWFFFPFFNRNHKLMHSECINTLLRNDVDPLNKYVTNVSVVFLILLDFKDVTNVSQFNWIIFLSKLYYSRISLFMYMSRKIFDFLNVMSLIQIDLSWFLTALHIHLNSGKWQIYSKYERWMLNTSKSNRDSEAEEFRLPRGWKPGIIIF